MTNSFYTGSYRDDALNEPNRGWLVGQFMKDISRKNDQVEIKYWEFKSGEDVRHGPKVSSVIECTFILEGKTRCLIDDREVILKAGDYIVIQPGVLNNVVAEILEDIVGLTVKAPSIPGSKKLIS